MVKKRDNVHVWLCSMMCTPRCYASLETTSDLLFIKSTGTHHHDKPQPPTLTPPAPSPPAAAQPRPQPTPLTVTPTPSALSTATLTPLAPSTAMPTPSASAPSHSAPREPKPDAYFVTTKHGARALVVKEQLFYKKRHNQDVDISHWRCAQF